MHGEHQQDDPSTLFEEYAQGALAGRPPDIDELRRRAGGRAADLDRMLGVARLLDGIREGADGPAAGGQAPAALGRFRDLHPLGQGGLSLVYRALDPELRREVALKVLSTPLGGGTEWVRNEGRSLARLEHAGVVRVHSLEDAGNQPFLVMDLVRGPSLREVLVGLRALAGRPEDGALPTIEARAAAERLAGIAPRCELVARIAEALAYCHRQGVVHRDIKPHNVLVDGSQPVLIDFGLAHLPAGEAAASDVTQRLVGTPAYVALEQVDSNRTGASPLSDQFSLGVLLYELLTLSHPFKLTTRTDTMTAISRAAPPLPRRVAPSIPADLERIVLHAMERDPAARYHDCAALAADLRAFLEHRAISLQPPTSLHVMRLWLRRNRRRLRWVAAAGALLAVAVPLASALDHRAARQQLTADLQALQAGLPRWSEPAPFEAAFLALSPLRQRAGESDASAWSLLEQRPSGAAVMDVALLCSERLAGVVAEQLAPANAQADSAAMLARTTLLLWSGAIALDRQVCPDSPHTRELHRRGQVEVPGVAAGGQLRLWRLGSDPLRAIVQEARPVAAGSPLLSATELGTGLYRARFRDPARSRAWEVDVPILPETPRWTLDPAAGAFELVDVPGREFRLPTPAPNVMDDLLVSVAPIRIMPRVVNWADVERVWPGRMQDLHVRSAIAVQVTGVPAALAPDDAACLTWNEAMELARSVGLRLPTLLELRGAWQAPGVQGPEPGSPLTGELVGDIDSLLLEMRQYATYDPAPEGDWLRWSAGQPTAAFRARLAFRLCQSATPWPEH